MADEQVNVTVETGETPNEAMESHPDWYTSLVGEVAGAREVAERAMVRADAAYDLASNAQDSAEVAAEVAVDAAEDASEASANAEDAATVAVVATSDAFQDASETEAEETSEDSEIAVVAISEEAETPAMDMVGDGVESREWEDPEEPPSRGHWINRPIGLRRR